MPMATGSKAEPTLRFWKASLAWKNIGGWAKGWTQESFIAEVRTLCADLGSLGSRADDLLDDMIHDVEERPRETPGIVVSLPLTPRTNNSGQQALSA
jgi:hypothetical protein